MPPLLHDRYRIRSKLGSTRLAVLYRATDERLRRSVLVHLLRPERQQQETLRQRFLEDAQRRARRPHPALLEVYDSGEVGSRPYVVTEDLEGQLLAEALPLPAHEALRVLRQVVGAVLACQEAGMQIPPITSHSILLTEERRPVLVEPWWLDETALRLHLAHYLAPERAAGGAATPATLVYSLGILGYELFGGQRPFRAETPQAVIQQHRQGQLPPALELLPGFAPRLAQLLTQATMSRPEQRLPDLTAMARELAAVEAASDTPTQQLALRPQAPRPIGQAVRETLRPVTGALRRPARPAAASLPPPPPVWTPPPAPPAPARPVPQPQPAEMRKEIERQVRREVRRQGCRRAIARRLLSLLLLLGVLGACAWGAVQGLNYGRSWVQSVDVRALCSERLPGLVCNLLPGAEGAQAVYVVRSDLNLRSEPRLDPGTIVGTLPAGTRVTPSGAPQVIDNITWLPVRVELNGQPVDGWVSFDYLRKEE